MKNRAIYIGNQMIKMIDPASGLSPGDQVFIEICSDNMDKKNEIQNYFSEANSKFKDALKRHSG